MAKKGQVQLQIEVNSEEEWEKLLEKSGLIVCDIYSEWAGPCVWMVPFLKKVKLDSLGDYLTLAIVNAEAVGCLSRFIDRSEPTFMFVRNQRVLSIMFGTNAPKLMEMMYAELKNDARMAQTKEYIQEGLLFDELTPDEDIRYQEELAIAREEVRIKEENARKTFNEHRLQQCRYLLEALNNIGIIFFYPHVGNDGMAAVSEEWDHLGLIVFNIARHHVTEEDLENLMWFEEKPISDDAKQVLLMYGHVLALLVKPINEDDDYDKDVDKLVLEAAYRSSRAPPGDPDCPAQKVVRAAEEGGPVVPGMWAPCNELSKAMALETFFPEVCRPHRLPEVEPPPPVLAVVFDSRKRQEAMDVAKEYPNEILHYGFFTSADPTKATLIAKTVKEYQASTGASLADKLVMCVARKRSDPVLSLAVHNPVYVSQTTEEGEKECAIFFPDDYEPQPEEAGDVKTKKKKGDQKAEQPTTSSVTENPEAPVEEESAPETEQEEPVDAVPEQVIVEEEQIPVEITEEIRQEITEEITEVTAGTDEPAPAE